MRSSPGRVQPDPEVQELQQSKLSPFRGLHDVAFDAGPTSEDTRHPLAPHHVVPSPGPLSSPPPPDPSLIRQEVL